MNKLSIILEFLLNNSTYILTITIGVIGFSIIIYSIRLILQSNLLSKYKECRKKIKSFEIVANESKIRMYKRKHFLRLKNKGKNPCEMDKKIEIDEFYLSPNNSMYIDITGGIY